MSFFKDAFAIFKKRELLFLESRKESEDVYSFLFEKDKDLTWTAGQYGLFSITHKNIKNVTKPFSMASAPTEKIVKITTRIRNNPSDFKKALLELQEGMKVKMSGPVGSFCLQDNSPSLLIAGGIGITPFRSILKQIESEGSEDGKQRKLLYLDGKKSYLYKDELDELADKTSISVAYLDSRDDLHQEIDKFNDVYSNNGSYFIAGPKAMVDSISGYLQSHNISKKNIKKDAFYGY
ncbi:FAD-dependent oxidoreductase [Cohnella herbarum]|uniref:FAD-dependent oxidoreductase n=1 Tax=Cohnella herbarum TaxID=2728023 RepID=A0A7Z2ZKI6_9BACL|nr:FAD-dependent oxidoreductase [Cohnella herbarum]QJD82819.1 FAD-dependent oxidoreductase [Cohnella herbarum]